MTTTSYPNYHFLFLVFEVTGFALDLLFLAGFVDCVDASSSSSITITSGSRLAEGFATLRFVPRVDDAVDPPETESVPPFAFPPPSILVVEFVDALATFEEAERDSPVRFLFLPAAALAPDTATEPFAVWSNFEAKLLAAELVLLKSRA